jgi:ABC-type nickel/cobalt efflux system permease component RcnA
LTGGSPLTGGKPPTEAKPPPAPPAATPAQTGWYVEFWRLVRDAQREASRQIGRHMAAIARGDSPTALLIGMMLAFLYGVLHTLGPGHGKMVVASYFLAHDAKIVRGLLMGLKIAVTHVISAIALVWLADITFRKMLGGSPAEVRWVQLASYASIAAIGLWMFYRAARRSFAPAHAGHSHEACAHDHGHDHARSHVHDARKARRQQSLLAVTAGLAPCTGALLIMLYALANGIVLSGILLVACISAGMAITIAVIGIFCILARQAALKAVKSESRPRRWLTQGLEYLGAAAITAIGALFFVGTLQGTVVAG